MSNFKNNNQPGFSLIEIMVAILIIGTVFVGLISAFPLALRIAKSAENRTRASYYAQEKIEELYQLNYGAITAGTIEARQPVGTEHPRSGYERETTVVYLDEAFNEAADDTGLKKITCRIYYPYALNKHETYFELSALIARR